MPSEPEASAWLTFMPKPRPMTEYCRSFFDMVLLNVGNALPKSRAKAKPMARAMGDDTHWATHAQGPKST